MQLIITTNWKGEEWVGLHLNKAPLGLEMPANAGRLKPYLILLLYHHKTFNGPHYRLTISTKKYSPTIAKRCSTKKCSLSRPPHPLLHSPWVISKEIGPVLPPLSKEFLVPPSLQKSEPTTGIGPSPASRTIHCMHSIVSWHIHGPSNGSY